jgi:acyl dehydratase
MSSQPAANELLATKTLPPFTQDEIRSFLKTVGDDNPLHHDFDLARTVGFARPPLPGMMLMIQLERFVDSVTQAQPVTHFACRFVRPILFGATLTLAAQPMVRRTDGELSGLRLTVTADGVVSITAEVTLAPAPSAR